MIHVPGAYLALVPGGAGIELLLHVFLCQLLLLHLLHRCLRTGRASRKNGGETGSHSQVCVD